MAAKEVGSGSENFERKLRVAMLLRMKVTTTRRSSHFACSVGGNVLVNTKLPILKVVDE